MPRLNEDFLLQAYWRRVRGRIYVEVPIGAPGGSGDWPSGCTRRRLDGVRLQSVRAPETILRFQASEFRAEMRSGDLELFEVKPCLNRLVIGQVIAGRDMFEREYGVSPTRCTIVFSKTDDALKWVCRRHGIHVEVVTTGTKNALPNNAPERSGRAGG